MNVLIKMFFLILVTAAFQGFGQVDENMKQEVEVIREYTPTISDAIKLNELPVIQDSVKTEASFLYQIESKQIPVDFQTEPVKPAKMNDEPLSKLYNSHVRVGFGNYLTPMAELYISNLRSKKFTWSAILKHQSSYGTIINDINKKVYTGYADNSVRVSGKKFINKKSLYGNLNYTDNSCYFYGYNTDDPAFENLYTGKRDLIRQQFARVSADGGIRSFHTDKNHISYDISGKYLYFYDLFNKAESSGLVTANLSQYYNKELLGVDFSAGLTQKNFNDTNSVIVKLNPWVNRVTNIWEVRVGLAMFADVYHDDHYYFFPDVSLQYAVVEKYLIPYTGFTGFAEENPYGKLSNENPFIRPGTDTRSTIHKKVLFGGIKGSVSSNTFYHIRATFSEMEHTYFFVNDTTKNEHNQRPGNMFVLTTTDATRLTLYGEISVKASEKLNFHVKGNYYYFDNMPHEKKAWHIPEFDITFSTVYNLQDKIILSVDIFGIGDRFAKIYEYSPTGIITENEKKLAPVVDANLHAEYRYNKKLSGFLHLNNIANQKYYRWNYYRMQGLNFLAGLSYSF